LKRAHLSLAAEGDLVEIWLHAAADKPIAADRLVERLRAKCRLLARTPLAGRERPRLGSGIRSFPTGNYLILYRAVEEGIDVVRIVSGYRDLDSLLEG